MAIFNMVSRAFVEDTGFGREIVDLMMKIVGKYREEEILTDMTGKLIKVCLALYFADAKKLS